MRSWGMQNSIFKQTTITIQKSIYNAQQQLRIGPLLGTLSSKHQISRSFISKILANFRSPEHSYPKSSMNLNEFLSSPFIYSISLFSTIFPKESLEVVFQVEAYLLLIIKICVSYQSEENEPNCLNEDILLLSWLNYMLNRVVPGILEMERSRIATKLLQRAIA